MNQTKYWLRWIAVLPGALGCALLLLFPLHWVLYQTFSSWIEPYPELPERVLTPFVIAAGFIWGGSRIAPSHKMETAVVLFGLWMVLMGGVITFTYFVGSIYGQYIFFRAHGLATAMAFIGTLCGLLIVRKQTKGLSTTDRNKGHSVERSR